VTHVDRLLSASPAFVGEMRRHQRRNLLLFAFEGAMFALAASFLAETTIIPTFLSSIVNSPLLVGVVIAVFALGHSVPQIVGAHLLQGRLRRKPLLLMLAGAERIGILGIAISAQLADVVPPEVVVGLFLLAFGGYAVTTGLLGPVYGEVLAKTIVDWRGQFFGSVQLIGGVLGFGAALAAEQIIGALPVPAGFQVLFWMALGVSLISIVFLSLTRDADLEVQAPVESLFSTVRRLPRVVAEDPSYVRFLTSRVIVALSGFAIGFVVLDAIDRGVTLSQVALLTAVLIASQAGLGFGFGFAGARFGWKPILIFGAACLVLGMIGAVIASDLIGYCLVFVALGGFRAASGIVDPNMSIELAPLGRTARYLAITPTVLAPFLVVGPIVGGLLVPIVGTTPLFIAATLLASAGLALAIRIREPR
jgi:MFS family permease